MLLSPGADWHEELRGYSKKCIYFNHQKQKAVDMTATYKLKGSERHRRKQSVTTMGSTIHEQGGDTKTMNLKGH